MVKATMHEAKTNLSELVERAQRGEEVIITSGRERKPVARVVAIGDAVQSARTPGLFKGRFKIGHDFDAPLPAEELDLWTGK
jgi:prevent-host-death family protein